MPKLAVPEIACAQPKANKLLPLGGVYNLEYLLKPYDSKYAANDIAANE